MKLLWFIAGVVIALFWLRTDMAWQDIVLSTGGAVFISCLIPILRKKDAAVPRSTSIGTGVVVAAYAAAHFSLGLPLTALMQAVTAALWLLVAIYRPVRTE